MAFSNKNTNNKSKEEVDKFGQQVTPDIKIETPSSESVYSDESIKRMSMRRKTQTEFHFKRGTFYTLNERKLEKTKVASPNQTPILIAKSPAEKGGQQKSCLTPQKQNLAPQKPNFTPQKVKFTPGKIKKSQQKQPEKKDSKIEVFFSDCRYPTQPLQNKRVEDLNRRPSEVHFATCSTEDLRVPQMKLHTTTKSQKVFPIPKYKQKDDSIEKPVALGQIVENARCSDDVTQAVKDRMALWPEGDEILSLLYLVKADQITPSFVKPIAKETFQTGDKGSSHESVGLKHSETHSIAMMTRKSLRKNSKDLSPTSKAHKF